MEQITNEANVQKKGGARVKPGTGKKPLIIVLAILALAAAGYLGLCAYAASLDVFQPNRHINGIDVGGLTVSQAQEKLETQLLSQGISLSDPDTGLQASITVADLGYPAEDFQRDAQFWMDTARQASFIRKGWAYLAYATGRWPGGANWPDPDQGTLNATVARLSEQLSQAPIDSAYEILDGEIVITKAKDGLSMREIVLRTALLDIATYSQNGYQVPVSFDPVAAKVLTAQEIYDEAAGEMKNAGYDAATDSIIPEQLGAEFDVAAAQAALDAAEPGETVSIPAVIEYPRVTAEQLKDVLFRDVLGECRTHVSGTAARISNVKLASAAFNGTVLNCGDVFSYNETVGQRTAARGYQPAPAYVRGETVDEIGGGVCQPSSTLYFACLLANLEITERYAHRYAPTYIEHGMDATVSWGGPDYKFTNNTDYPIKVVATYANNYLTVKLLGTKVDGTTVKMTKDKLSTTPFEVVYEDDPTLPAGTEQVKTTPYIGYKYKTYRNVYDADGKLISSTYEATSDYKSRNRVILRGPALPVSEPSAPASNPEELPVESPETPDGEASGEAAAPPVTELPQEEIPVIVITPDEPAE